MLSVVQWFGGKGSQLADLLPLIPETRGYVEPFGGGGSVLMNRSPSKLEVYNDLNGEIVNLFRVISDEIAFESFARRVESTLWSKEEFRTAILIQKGDLKSALASPGFHDEWQEEPWLNVERAWALYVIQNQGISGTHSKSEGNWSRSKLDNKNCDKWKRLKERLEPVHRRFMGVQIDSQDALKCIEYWDGPDVTFYIDPPYVLNTRQGSGKQYEHEMEDSDHGRLIEVLLQVSGPVVLSGYEHPIYEPLSEAGWDVHRYKARASTKVASAAAGEGKPERVEVVWRNPQAMSHVIQGRLL